MTTDSLICKVIYRRGLAARSNQNEAECTQDIALYRQGPIYRRRRELMFSPRHFLRMAKWARHPPSDSRVKLVLGILALCLVLFGIERLIGWPDWLTMANTPRGKIN